jgi:predicted ATPase
MGEVFLAQQINLNRLVVIKQVPPGRASEQHVRALLEEARVAARLHHPNIVSILDVSRDGEVPFVAMEYLAGVSLREMIERSLALPLSVALPIALDLLRGLSYAHQVRTGKHLGVIHRDVKPRNVMVTFAGVTKLIDFGISRWLGGADEKELAVSGTRGYMAPEQHEAGRMEGSADQYAVGVTLYEMVTGALPRGGDATQIDKPGIAEAFVPRVPIDPELDAVVSRSLAVRPADRWPDCNAMAEELEALARNRGLALGAAEVQRWVLSHFPTEHEATEAESAGLAEEGEATQLGDPATSPTNLAPAVDGFVGREPELARIAAKFAHGSRLITLLGGPGIGKTRLGREHAWRERENYAGGAWFVDLTEARTLEGVAIGIAAALGVSGLDATLEGMLRQLGAAIAHRGSTLLVLDNFEQVVDHASVVGRLADLAPSARWLVTSRERLNLPVEVVIEVGPLTGSNDGDALALLLERARTARPGLALGIAELDELAVVVDRLEGNPLAIELAAGRLKVLTPRQLRDRLASGFDVLTGRRRGVPERQTAFDKAVEWSWQMLEPFEQAALSQAAVFRGGFSIEAAEAVIDLSAHASAPDVIDVLESLGDKSLLRRLAAPELPDDARFGMYEGIRSFAAAKLEAAGALAAARARHGDYFLAYAETWAARDAYPDVRSRANRLGAERENIWALVEPALTGPIEPAAAVRAVRALATLVPIYEGRGLRSLFRRAYDALLDGDLVDTAPPAALAVAWRERARVIPRGQVDLAWTYMQKSLEIARAHDLAEHVAWGIFRALPVASDRKDVAARDAMVDDATRRFAGDAHRDWRAVATSLLLSFQKIAGTEPALLSAIEADVVATAAVSRRPSVLAQIAWALAVHRIVNGDIEGSRPHFMRVVELYEETGDDQPSLALARGNVAAINLGLDRDLVAARNLAELSRRSLLEMGLPESVPFNDFNLALIREGLGDYIGAEVEARRCLERQTAAGTASNWLLRGDTGRVAAAAQLAIAVSQLGRADEAQSLIDDAFAWTAKWIDDPPSSEPMMEAARAILDVARCHCVLARADLDSLPTVLDTARAHLAAARARSQAQWSDEVHVIVRRAQRRIDDTEAELFGAAPGDSTSHSR